MKKVLLVSIISAVIWIVFSLEPSWFKFLWGFQILLLPILAGIFMVLVQNENKSYRFGLKLVVGSLVTSFIYSFSLNIIEYSKYAQNHSQAFFQFSDLFNIIAFALFLTGVCIFGGLIGIVIRGSSLLLSKK